MSEVFGAWRLESNRRFHDGQFDRDTMGPEPFGRILYSPAGYMSASLASAAFRRGEAPLDWRNFLAYSGPFELTDDGTVVHHLDFSCYTSMIGTDLVRFVEWVSDDTIKLKTAPHTNKQGKVVFDELVWHRVTD